VGHIVTERDGAVGRISIDAPERLNAVDVAMLDGIAEAVRRLAATDGVRVIALTGSGRGFCSGASLDAIAAPTSGGTQAQGGGGTLAAVARAVRAVTDATVPVVALVNGVAAGVGCSLALASSYVLATESAYFMLAFAKIGLMPDGGATAMVAAHVGRARALRMALTAEKVSARTAADWGLVAEACPDVVFAARSAELLAELAAGPTRALAATVAAVNAAALADLHGALAREEAGQTRLITEPDFTEGLAAFTERRPARFEGQIVEPVLPVVCPVVPPT
jgi:enoyl-CoA hydratase